jgi:hypothetical protein
MDATGEKMKKIVMKESRGEYTFVGTLNGAETEKVRTLLDRDPNINIEVDEEEGQRYDTYITSDVYTNKDIEHAVKMAKGEISSSTSPSSAGAGVAKFLTKERLMKMIKEELEETFDGMEPMDRTGLDEIDFDQIAMGDMGDNQTTQPKASFEGKWTNIKDKNEFISKFHISSSSPLVDIVARAIGSRENYAITNKDGKFYVYTFTQTANPGKPSQPFNSLEDAKKSVKL